MHGAICMGIIMTRKLNEQDDGCHSQLDAYAVEEKYAFFVWWPKSGGPISYLCLPQTIAINIQLSSYISTHEYIFLLRLLENSRRMKQAKLEI